ncbi:reverse transcriptase domain-containing protein [Tanacetum coccineum]
MTNEREITPPPGFLTPPYIPNVNTNERPPITTTVFAATIPGNMPFAYRVPTLTVPAPMISPAFIKANYEILESLLRDRRRQIRNENLQTELEYFSEDYDEEHEMEPRPERIREVTPPLRTRSPMVRRQRERVVGFEEAPNKEGSRTRRNTEGNKPSEAGAKENGSQKAGSIINYEDLKAKFQSHFSQQKRFTKTHLAVHSIKQREGESVKAFATRYTDDTLQILGLHEDQRISGFVHGLKTRNLVEYLSTNLLSTYKGLMEKTYTWIKAREVAH